MDQVDTFIARTAPSKVAIVVPLFGYWNTVPNNELNEKLLRLTLKQLHSQNHALYFFFVAEAAKTSNELANELTVLAHAGNVKGVSIPSGSSYGDYVREGLHVARTETEAAFFVVFDPRSIVQKNAIDVLIDRVNSSDEAKMVSGYDIADTIHADTEEDFMATFEAYHNPTPKEERAIDFSFMGVARYTLEMILLDENFRTPGYMQYDIWQQLFKMGFEAITSQQIPIYLIPENMKMYEKAEARELDRVYFTSKWGFAPDLKD